MRASTLRAAAAGTEALREKGEGDGGGGGREKAAAAGGDWACGGGVRGWTGPNLRWIGPEMGLNEALQLLAEEWRTTAILPPPSSRALGGVAGTPPPPRLRLLLRRRFESMGHYHTRERSTSPIAPPWMVLAEAALRLWLAAEPRELRVELGLLYSRAIARRVEFDATVLDDAVPGIFLARVDCMAVAEVELVASPWSAPGLDAVVRGVTHRPACPSPREEQRGEE
uniref:Uncharacterized protein n=2 Tax=Oryza sativa subsp. japonica TaxID=39947 RepID=Q852D6_ORYSJ|nr:hypothetical protein [Oryza sativa Japonica Group]ABF99905.1 hypothetical protein LOC_Os03g63210 [Oryza sativa Japonica Group]